MLVSGAIGIGIGDTAFSIALNRMGEQRTLLISQTLAPIFAASIAAVWLGEVLSGVGYIGIVMTLFGIGVVIFERTGNHADRFNLRIGVLAGVVAAVCQSIGVVITRDVFIEENTRPLLDASMFAMWTALLRILAGAILLLPLIPLFNLLFPHRKQSLVTKGVSSRNLWKLLVYATILGTYLGIFLQQFALQTTTVALAQTLFAFSSIWALGFDWFGPKKPGRRSFIGAAIAIGGIAVVLTSG